MCQNKNSRNLQITNSGNNSQENPILLSDGDPNSPAKLSIVQETERTLPNDSSEKNEASI